MQHDPENTERDCETVSQASKDDVPECSSSFSISSLASAATDQTESTYAVPSHYPNNISPQRFCETRSRCISENERSRNKDSSECPQLRTRSFPMENVAHQSLLEIPGACQTVVGGGFGNWSARYPDVNTIHETNGVLPDRPWISSGGPALGSVGSSHAEVTKPSVEILKQASALYGALITMTSASLTLTSHLTPNVDSNSSRWFDCGMLGTGICFLIFSFVCYFPKSNKNFTNIHQILADIGATVERGEPAENVSTTGSIRDSKKKSTLESSFRRVFMLTKPWSPPVAPEYAISTDGDTGSFYLKIGALIFAVGSMIYMGLELGVYIENQSCFNVVMAIEPCFFVVYVMLQLYFIFHSSKLRFTKYVTICWFGMIHLVATDICIWIRILIDETQHEFTVIASKKANETHRSTLPGTIGIHASSEEQTDYAPLCVNEESLMKESLEKASTFLYPCIIEYTLITAGIIFTMWQLLETKPLQKLSQGAGKKEEPGPQNRYSVDCDQASRGLFGGILVGVLSTVGIIIFFVFIDQDSHQLDLLAVLCGQIMQIILNVFGLLASLYCIMQFVRNLEKVEIKTINTQLTDGLLIVCMIGVYAYCIISLLGTYKVDSSSDGISAAAACLQMLQATVQTIYIVDATKRGFRSSSRSQHPTTRKKPAREALTFLLFLNFALWAVNVFCAMRTDASPAQRDFFGAAEWAVVLHVTVPLVIFYRFHSTVCLVDIWKRAYKVKRSEEKL